MSGRRSSILSEDEHASLEKQLSRSFDRGAPGGSMAHSLSGMAKKLEKNMIKDNLNQSLFTREHVDMKQVFKGGDERVAPRLRSSIIKLEQEMNKNSVARKLEARPQPEDLEKRGLMQSQVARSIQGVQRRLSHNMTTDKLGHLLEKRSEIEDLIAAGIVNDQGVAPSIQAN